jgi:hypothetical protein
MDWIRQNRFLATYLAIFVPLLLLLGYFVYASAGRASQVADDYAAQVTELQRLQKLEPYPDASSVERIEDMRGTFSDAVSQLQKQLAGREPAPEFPRLSPVQFQDKLRQLVDETTKAAQTAGMALPDNFYLGFEQYRAALPEDAATAGLDAELGAVRDLVDLLIKAHLERLISIKRAPLPHEQSASAAAAAAANAPTPKAVSKQQAETVIRSPVQIEIEGLPNALRDALNAIAQAPRLYAISALIVKNGMDKVPERGQNEQVGGAGAGTAPSPSASPAAGAAPEASPAPAAEKGAVPLRYIVGVEKVSAIARIDLVKVLPAH